MSDPEEGNVQAVVVKRRRSRRHRRNRLLRRWLVATTIGLFAVGISAVALRYLSPSLFRAQSASPTLQQAELSRNRLRTLNQIVASSYADRPVYPYSVVPGGVQDAKELKWVAEHDPIVAAHYAGFDYARARVVRLTLDRTVHVSYRIGNHIYWTRRRLTLHKGEKLITDGRMTARSRCANRVEESPQQEASPAEPPVQKFDEPVRYGDGTAQQSPPVPFQSALLNPPGQPGLGPAGPLSLYNPFVGGAWIPISPPPLPAGLCGPAKTKGTGGSTGTGTGKNKGGPCGGGSTGTGVVPEPGTWLMFASGLAAIYWCARRKFARA
ncbi:MAG: PEP-CTERM sorting domain-containing protein [Candidatus Sulfotelmatobacter sp.]